MEYLFSLYQSSYSDIEGCPLSSRFLNLSFENLHFFFCVYNLQLLSAFFLLDIGTAGNAFIHERELGIDIFEMQITASFLFE